MARRGLRQGRRRPRGHRRGPRRRDLDRGSGRLGNGIGLDRDALQALDADDRDRRIAAATAELRAAGADYVVGSVAELWPVLESIAARIEAGETPRA